MSFVSLSFLFFFLIVTALYFVLPHRFRALLLLVASCIFYMAFVPIYILIIFLTIIIDYIAALFIDTAAGKKRKLFLIISILSNVGVLIFFKYYGFLTANLEGLSQLFHWNLTVPFLNIILPIGLSFHTFQAMSYTIEVYRGKQKPERNLLIYALYVMFYPQLVAGPIERPQNMLHQFREHHTFDWGRVSEGLFLMLWGFFKKIVIADNIGHLVNTIYNHPTQFTGGPLILATLLFGLQIYCDFSGYSDIALGSAKVMGFDLMINFNAPYFSQSIAEFWRRWHISLSSWFRDYVYIPLGGNRVGTLKRYRNLLIVFLISGIWHGANWTYVAWGAFHGLYLIVSDATRKLRSSMVFLTKISATAKKISAITVTYLLVNFSWIFFRANSLSDAWYIITHLFSASAFRMVNGWVPLTTINQIILKTFASYYNFFTILTAVCFVGFLEYIYQNSLMTRFIQGKILWQKIAIYTALLLWIIYFGFFSGPSPFIYFQF